MNATDAVTIRYNARHGEYILTPDGTEAALAALTGTVDPGAWAHAIGEACEAGQAVTLGALAARITEAQQRLLKAQAKKGNGNSRVLCDCGHRVERSLVMSASLGSSCPDCYDRMSN